MDLARFSPRTIMAAATVAMLVQQAFSYVCQIALPILADQIAEDFGISRAWLGFYLFLQNVAAIIAAVGCGGFILRYGPLRVSQVALLLMGSSLLVTASGLLWLFPLGALLLGAASVSTPASSHILARVTPLRLAPLVFSIKQTGVPVGALIGGLLIPFLLGLAFYSDTLGVSVRLGPYGASFITCLIVFAVMVSLERVRSFFDAEPPARHEDRLQRPAGTLKTVAGNPPAPRLSLRHSRRRACNRSFPASSSSTSSTAWTIRKPKPAPLSPSHRSPPSGRASCGARSAAAPFRRASSWRASGW